jgi:hypothetical protein
MWPCRQCKVPLIHEGRISLSSVVSGYIHSGSAIARGSAKRTSFAQLLHIEFR